MLRHERCLPLNLGSRPVREKRSGHRLHARLGGLLMSGLLVCCRANPEPIPEIQPPPLPVPSVDERSLSILLDPPAEAWDFDASLPRAGLMSVELGCPLAQANTALILFHGYGAEGDDLVGLSRVLDVAEDTALVFPAAPVALSRGGRAWFRRDRSNLEAGVRRAQRFVEDLKSEYRQLNVVVGGFSQGAMLTANLVQQGEPSLAAAVLLSPADALLAAPQSASRSLPIFISHGTVDPVLPFAGAERLRDAFDRAGHAVTWVPFVGRHQIPLSVIEQLNGFLDELRRAESR